MKLVVGLGNPGARYDGTRHNIGFAVVDELARRWQIDLKREKFHAWFGDGSACDERVALLKPTTFMNRSGQAVLAAGRFYRAEKEDLLVILDDIALPLGRIRIREEGSAGSHNGLQDVIDRVGFSDFARLRIGVDEPIGDPSGYVLGRFRDEERSAAAEMISRSADATECWLRHGPVEAMNRYNGTGD